MKLSLSRMKQSEKLMNLSSAEYKLIVVSSYNCGHIFIHMQMRLQKVTYK